MATNTFVKPPNYILAAMHNPNIVVGRGDKYYDKDGKEVTTPSQAELDVQEAKVKADFDKDYANRRIAEYPKIGDQLDALYKAGVFDSTMTATIKAVKDKYPKA